VFVSRALPDGTSQETPLGAAAFDDSKGKPELVQISLVFRSFLSDQLTVSVSFKCPDADWVL
jgi:hypothetical protein